MIRILTHKQSDSQLTMRTEGLSTIGHSEVQVEFHDSELIGEAEGFLRYVSDYVMKSGTKLCAGQTMRYGYWITEFRNAGENTLETWEYNAPATDLVQGVSLTLRYWKDQHSICNQYNADFKPPPLDQVSVISKGVFEGLPVQGVRYPSEAQLSGWWITTDHYDGDINSLMNEHNYHVTASRPDLAKYMALPPGFRFDLSSFEDVWFEEEVAKA